MIFYLLNKGQQTVKLLNNDETIESNLDEAINTASELKFSLPLQKRLDSNIYYILIPEYHGNDFLMFKVISEDVQKDRVEYSAVESAYDELKSYEYIKDIRPHQMNAAQMLQQVLKNTRWSLGYVEDTGIQSTTFYYITILEAIQKIVDLFKVELTFTIQLDPVTQKITGRKVNLYQQQGRRTGKRFEYGSNLLTVTREEDSQNLVTALVGRGKGVQVSGQDTEDTTDDGYGRRLTFADVEWKTSAGAPVNKPKGQEYVEDPKATALYGFSDGHPRIGLVTFEDIEDPNQLINATWSALLEAKRPKVSFKAEVTNVGNLQLGDTIAIIRHDLGIEYFTRVYKVHHNLKDENRNTVEMGDDFSSRSITSAISNAIQISQDATTIANTAAIAANGKNRNFYSNTKPLFANEGDNLFLNLGNGETEMWVWHHGQWEFVQSTVELHTVQKEVKEAQEGLKDAKKEIADNLAKADEDIADLNASIDNQNSIINTNVLPKITDITNQVSDAVTKVNKQQDIVTNLQTQSIEQGKDISKVTTDVHGISVDLANLNGDVSSTKATVEGLQSTLGNAQGDIAQIKVDAKKLEASLSGKVDNSTYANFVSATNNALNAKLVASDLNGYARTTDLQATANGLQLNINSVTDKLNNLRIGADNLLNGTGNFKDYLTNVGGQIDEFSKTDYIPPIQNHPEITAYMHSWRDWQSAYSNQRILLEKGKTYWFGFYYCTDSSGSPCKAFNISSNKNNETSNAKLWGYFDTSDYSFFGNSSRKWLWCTLKIIGDGAVYQNFRVEPSGIVTNSAYFAGYTLVQSDVAPTGHVDSFEDTKHELSQLSAQITANNQKFSSYYTKIETDNRANSAKNDAVNAIKNDNNWHGLSNILTNSGFLQNADGFIQKVQQATVPMFSGSGINLVSGTSNVWGDSGWNDFNGTSNQTKVIGKFSLNGLTAGDWVTLHLDYQYQNLSGSNLSIIVQGTGDKTGSSYEPFNLPWKSLQASSNLNWGSFNKTFQITNEALKNNYFTVQIRIDNAKGGWLQWRNFKIEKGKVATPWSASPNDYTNLQSQISQTAGTIRSEVTNKTTNLQSQITQNANNFNVRLQNATSGGGINLARNTSDVWSDSGWNNFNGASNQTKIITQVYFEGLHVGDWVTGHIEYKYQNLSGNNMYIRIQGFGNKTKWNGSQFSSSVQQLSASNDVKFGKFEFNFQLTEDMINTGRNNYYNVQFRVDNAKDGWLQWSRIKFEKGTTATPWSPSPNDKVSKNKILAQINVAAGTTLIQNDKIYMDASSTVFSGKAFIPDAAITNISADKINTGTLDAGRINVINLNANNITTGTINGANLKINLNSGEILFQKGRIASTNGNLNIDIDSGTMSVTNWMNEGVYFKDGKLILDDRGFGGLIEDNPKYGVIQRSNQMFNNNAFGMELNSPNGVSLRTSNYDGVINTGSGLDGTKNGAVISVDKDGSAVVNGAGTTFLTGGPKFSQSKYSIGTRPHIWIGTFNARLGDRIEIDANYIHLPTTYYRTTGSAPNLCIASDGALVRSTSASKYKTDIKRSYSTEYGEKLLNLPTAIWTDKGQKERYKAGKRHIKPEKYFGMIAEDLADAGLDLLVSRNPQTHEIEGIQYERIAPALLPVIKKLKDKVNRLEKQINER